MRAGRLNAARYWAGSAVFASFALIAWRSALQQLPWEYFRGASAYGANISGGTFDLFAVLLLPLIGNLLIMRAARRNRAAFVLRRLHLLTWLGVCVGALLLLQPAALGIWIFLLVIVLIPTQLTLLSATFATLAVSAGRQPA